jgi:hypothetical protein
MLENLARRESANVEDVTGLVPGMAGPLIKNRLAGQHGSGQQKHRTNCQEGTSAQHGCGLAKKNNYGRPPCSVPNSKYTTKLLIR